MLDSDLAKLYHVETKRINEAVKNNYEKFPERFSWILSNEEWSLLRSKISTLEANHIGKGKYRKYLPRVFSEQGVAMLATILKSSIATQVSIRIMDAFVAMHKYISSNLLEQKYINNQVMKNTEDIKLLQDSFKKFEEKRKINEIYFNGQIYDAYSKMVDILNEAKKEIIIIDAYADKTILDMISKTKTNTLLITKKHNSLSELDISKYNEQYNNLKIIYNNTFHDRYIILDNTTVYHLGTSINHAGSKTFGINILTDDFVIDNLINKISKIT